MCAYAAHRFLIIAGTRTSGEFRNRYDYAAAESQIEFGEEAIMETNELIRARVRKVYARTGSDSFRLFPEQEPRRSYPRSLDCFAPLAMTRQPTSPRRSARARTRGRRSRAPRIWCARPRQP